MLSRHRRCKCATCHAQPNTGSEAIQEQEAGTTKTGSCVHLLRRPDMQAGSKCSHEPVFFGLHVVSLETRPPPQWLLVNWMIARCGLLLCLQVRPHPFRRRYTTLHNQLTHVSIIAHLYPIVKGVNLKF